VKGKPARVLIIAGSDSSGGAGLQADIKTAEAFGCYAMTAVTAVTVQNTLGVTGVHHIPPNLVRDQIVACLSDIGTDAIKTGMLASAAIAHAWPMGASRRKRATRATVSPRNAAPRRNASSRTSRRWGAEKVSSRTSRTGILHPAWDKARISLQCGFGQHRKIKAVRAWRSVA